MNHLHSLVDRVNVCKVKGLRVQGHHPCTIAAAAAGTAVTGECRQCCCRLWVVSVEVLQHAQQ